MTAILPHHDSAAFLEVVNLAKARGLHKNAGWYVRRTCDCHRRELVSMPFGTKAEAERCLRVLDEPRNRGPIR
jgi:hypothetical protein